MSLLALIVVLLIAGVLMALVPMDPEMKRLIYIVCIVIVVVVLALFLFRVLGVSDLRIPW